MSKKIMALLLIVISTIGLTGCTYTKNKSDSTASESVNIDEIKDQVKKEMQEEQTKEDEEKEKMKDEIKEELQDDNSNKKVDVNINNNTEVKSPNTTVVVEDTSPTIPSSVYHSNRFIFPDSSNVYLTYSQVAALSNYELGIARNEIYARHGYIFNLDQFKRYFESQNWYVPSYRNQSSISLNKIEQYNVDLIKKEEDRRGVKW